MIRKSPWLIALIVAVTSCAFLYEFREIKEIPGWRWSASESYSFTYEADANKRLDGLLLFRHVHGFQLSEVSFFIEITSEGSAWDTTIVLPVKDSEGEYLGQGSGDLWDLETSIFSNKKFATGRHRVSVSQRTADPLALAMEVGVQLTEVN